MACANFASLTKFACYILSLKVKKKVLTVSLCIWRRSMLASSIGVATSIILGFVNAMQIKYAKLSCNWHVLTINYLCNTCAFANFC